MARMTKALVVVMMMLSMLVAAALADLSLANNAVTVVGATGSGAITLTGTSGKTFTFTLSSLQEVNSASSPIAYNNTLGSLAHAVTYGGTTFTGANGQSNVPAGSVSVNTDHIGIFNSSNLYTGNQCVVNVDAFLINSSSTVFVPQGLAQQSFAVTNNSVVIQVQINNWAVVNPTDNFFFSGALATAGGNGGASGYMLTLDDGATLQLVMVGNSNTGAQNVSVVSTSVAGGSASFTASMPVHTTMQFYFVFTANTATGSFESPSASPTKGGGGGGGGGSGSSASSLSSALVGAARLLF